jgi:hypothetical protein
MPARRSWTIGELTNEVIGNLSSTGAVAAYVSAPNCALPKPGIPGLAFLRRATVASEADANGVSSAAPPGLDVGNAPAGLW